MKLLITAAVLLAAASAASAQTQVPLTISGSQAKGRIELPGGIGADLTIVFESVVGLNPGALEATASVANPLDASLLSRLPAGGGVSLPAAFPVLLRIEPSEQSALSFSGVVTVSLHTENLTLQTNSPLALYSGPAGGALQDITGTVGMGSYRAGGSKGGFSDFMIVADTRPINAVITQKFDRLQALLTQYQAGIEASVFGDLQARLNNARALFAAGSTLAAKTEVAAFGDAVKAASGVAIPDVWRAHDELANVAGLLRSGADTLRFSLDKKS